MLPRSLVTLFALALLVASCGGAPDAAPAGAQVVAEMSDYKITVSVPSVKAGSVKIGVRNLASMEHSFQVIKTDLAPDKLPVDGASAKANEDGKVGELKSIPGGKSAARLATSNSAIWTALVAAPLRRLSLTHQNASPLGLDRSSRILPMNTSSRSSQEIGIG